MRFSKITCWTLLLAAFLPAIRLPRASAEEAMPGLLPPVRLPPLPDPLSTGAAEIQQTSDGPAYNVVRFAAGTVELAVPSNWTVKQVPLPREIRLVTGPGEIPDDPSRLERGLWLA